MTTHSQSDLVASDPAVRSGASTPGQPADAVLMTAAGLEELRDELERLRRRYRDEFTAGLRDARSYGGGSNNDEYHALREEQMVVEARITHLEDTVARAVVVRPDEVADGMVAVGSTVVIEDLSSGGGIRRYGLAGAHHSLDANSISAASPMGQALIGALPGAVVTVELPNGRSRSVRVIAVEGTERAA
jgi:transcription elongation factor GreA